MGSAGLVLSLVTCVCFISVSSGQQDITKLMTKLTGTELTPVMKCLNNRMFDTKNRESSYQWIDSFPANNLCSGSNAKDVGNWIKSITEGKQFSDSGACATEKTFKDPVLLQACSPGFYLNLDGKADVCQPGFYCPNNLICELPCLAGAYCPPAKGYDFNSGTSQPCLTQTYALDNATQCGGWGTFQVPCPAGYFCKTPLDKEICPKGYFCRSGSVEPLHCPPISRSFCKEGTSTPPNIVLGLILIVIIFALFALVYAFGTVVLKRRATIAKDRMDRFLEIESMRMMSPTGESGAGGYGAVTQPQKSFVMDIAFRDLGLALKTNGAKVLSGVTGSIRAGRVTAIMGPSGAGKTTFLNTLSGKAVYGNTTGQIYVNGVPVDSINAYKRVIGFVPQEDTMIRQLSVRETLEFYAKLRASRTSSSAERKQVVDQTISMLRLPADILESQIGDEESRGVSGGQRKRVNIGMEMVGDPTVLFLDEPTSGLDSTTSLEVLRALKNLATDRGVAVVAVLHQPRYEIFRMFDDVLLLAKGGRTAYIGPTADALPYFESIGLKCPQRVNPADFYMDAISGMSTADPDTGDVAPFPDVDIVQAWKDKIGDFDPTDTKGSLANGNTGSYVAPLMPHPAQQGWWYFRRAILQQYRNFSALVKDLCFVLLAGTLLGVLFRDNKTLGNIMTISLMTSMAIGLTSSLSALSTFGGERVVYWRECSMMASKSAYFLAKIVSDFPRILMAPLVYLSLFYVLTSVRAHAGTFFVILLVSQWAGSGFGYFVSVFVQPKNAQTVAAVGSLSFCMLAGSSPKLPQLGEGQFLTWFSYARWMVEGLYVEDSRSWPDVYGAEVCASWEKLGYLTDGYNIVPLCVGLLFVQGLVFRLLAFLGLVFMNRDKQV